MRTQGRGMLVIGVVAILGGGSFALLGLINGDDEALVRGGLFAVLGLFAVYVSRTIPPRRR